MVWKSKKDGAGRRTGWKTVVLAVCLGAAATYGVAYGLLIAITQVTIAEIEQFAAARGVHLADTTVAGTHISFPRVIRWEQVRTSVGLEQGSLFGEARRFSAEIGELRLHITGLSWHRVGLEFSGTRLNLAAADRVDTSSGEPAREGLFDASFRVAFAVDPRHLAAGVHAVLQQVNTLLQSGRAPLRAEVSGLGRFNTGKSLQEAHVTATWNGRETELHLNREDVVRISLGYERQLTESEINLVADHPIQAPRLLRIKQYAEHVSVQAHRADPSVPEDAYRHVLWSYLLTKAFGPVFAEKVTDAHEVGAVLYNTPAEHRMDYHNNAVGRRYAAGGVPEAKILDLVRNSPDVVRVAE